MTTMVRQLGRAAHAERWLDRIAPENLPPGVERVVSHAWSKWYRARLEGQPLFIVLEVECWFGELWAHLSVTGRAGKPTQPELVFCRDVFLGDRKAIQLFPRKADIEVAESARTLHLYAPLETDPLPNFRPRDAAAEEVCR